MAKKKTPTPVDPFQQTDEAFDAIVASMRKLRQRMFVAYTRKQSLDEQLLRGLAMAIDGTTAALPEPTKAEAEAYADAEEMMDALLDDSDDACMVDAMDPLDIRLAKPESNFEAEEEATEEEDQAAWEMKARAADYVVYLARSFGIDEKGDPKPM